MLFSHNLLWRSQLEMYRLFEHVFQFQVSSYEEAGDVDEEKYMMDAPCMKNLMQLTGFVTFQCSY